MSDPANAERRPIASRETAWARAISSFLGRIGCTPNGISVAGMFAGVLAGVCFACTRIEGFHIAGFLLGALCVQLRLAANMFDGMVAIETGQRSPVGELYNEVPDRISDIGTLVGAGYAIGGMPELGLWAAAMAVLTAYVRAQGKAAGAPNDFCGPMAKQHRMAVITISAVVAAYLPATWLPKWEQFPTAGVISLALAIIIVGCVFTVLRRLSRMSAYLRKNKA
ncbi:CDP-alcohol phosphatidyltransferase family protein [Anatilimnocola floriformis]|uniref:CDP-alcohol phosphatidyltransferase family protein n=1 Tax=Anatilimnocola floriformis TaxID=2948575 RepID=UPI0020C34EBA|nr:CDP-alcohol phosphatidyltransferase family protein [Anatilimnocola floriformis]